MYAIRSYYGVSTTPDVTGSDQALALRQMQTREYDTLDRDMTLRSVVATLQDLGFTIDSADAKIGTVTASRYYQKQKYDTHVMRMTVTVRDKDGERIAVRRITSYNVCYTKLLRVKYCAHE